jgi:hypothetical protein
MSKNPSILNLESILQESSQPEKKIRILLDKMKEILAADQGVDFKLFWAANDLVLALFKESVPPHLRNFLWSEYKELRDQIQLIKKHQGEQSAFTAEQFILAIEDLEKKDREELATQEERAIQNLSSIDELKPNKELYKKAVIRNQILSAKIARINSLRKELSEIQLHGKWRKEIFEKLSAIADIIFPERRDLIKEVSDQFTKDVEVFVQKNFSSQRKIDSFHVRNSIQTLQMLLKLLPLNKEAFKAVRKALSEKWDVLNTLDEKSKEETNAQFAVAKQEYKKIKDSLEEISCAFSDKTLSLDDAEKQLDVLEKTFFEARFPRDVFQEGKKAIYQLKSLLQDSYNQIQVKKKEKKEALKEEQEKAFISLQEELENLSHDTLFGASRRDEIDKIEEELSLHVFSSAQKEFIEVRLDLYKEKLLLAQEGLGDLTPQMLLLERQKRRKNAKIELEALRKKSAGSGMDFALASHLAECLELVERRIKLIDSALKQK